MKLSTKIFLSEFKNGEYKFHAESIEKEILSLENQIVNLKRDLENSLEVLASVIAKHLGADRADITV